MWTRISYNDVHSPLHIICLLNVRIRYRNKVNIDSLSSTTEYESHTMFSYLFIFSLSHDPTHDIFPLLGNLEIVRQESLTR